jgi:hypothetical protein
MIVKIEKGRVPTSSGDSAPEFAVGVEKEGNLPGVRPDIGTGGIPEKESLPQG